MSGTTTRLQLPYPGPTDGPDGADVPYWAQLLAEALDNSALWGQGILADRPVSTPASPGVTGRFYYVIGDTTSANNGVLWVDYGTGWTHVNSAGTIVDTLNHRPAANAVPSGTKFFATDQVTEYVSNGSTWLRVTEAAGKVSICLASSSDAGHILLQGQAWPSTTGIYADLYAKFGGTNLPDFTQKVPVGFKTGDTDFGALLASGGEKKHTLTIGEMPSHHHELPRQGLNLNTGSTPYLINVRDSHTNDEQTDDVGGGLAHNNLQPFLVVNFQAKL